jgi:hypothetical protein
MASALLLALWTFGAWASTSGLPDGGIQFEARCPARAVIGEAHWFNCDVVLRNASPRPVLVNARLFASPDHMNREIATDVVDADTGERRSGGYLINARLPEAEDFRELAPGEEVRRQISAFVRTPVKPGRYLVTIKLWLGAWSRGWRGESVVGPLPIELAP